MPKEINLENNSQKAAEEFSRALAGFEDSLRAVLDQDGPIFIEDMQKAMGPHGHGDGEEKQAGKNK